MHILLALLIAYNTVYSPVEIGRVVLQKPTQPTPSRVLGIASSTVYQADPSPEDERWRQNHNPIRMPFISHAIIK